MKINMKSKSVTLATKGCYCPEDVEVAAVLQEKTVTENGEVVSDSGFAGLSKVTVAVPEPDAKIVDVTELPTADIDDSIYYRLDGKLFKYKPETAVGTWVLNENFVPISLYSPLAGTISVPIPTAAETVSSNMLLATSFEPAQTPIIGVSSSSSPPGYANFSGNGVALTDHEVSGVGTASVIQSGNAGPLFHDGFVYQIDCQAIIDGKPYTFSFPENILRDYPIYRTINITEGTATLLAWLKANATRQDVSGAGWECYLVPSGSLEITENSTVDVTDKNEVVVNVPSKEPTIDPIVIAENGVVTLPEGVDGFAPITVNVPQSIPTDVATASEMTALLTEANVGKVYRFTGTTDDTYTNGDLYLVEEATA